jgi:ElaB/YqjD/DUF883 family membrane-anchored ribosome-binding protein
VDFEALLPLILLIIWAILSARLKGKGRQDSGPEPVSPSDDSGGPVPERKSPPKGKSLFENLRETLDSVMQEMSQQADERGPQAKQESKKSLKSAEEKRSERMARAERRRQEKGMDKDEFEFLHHPSEPLKPSAPAAAKPRKETITLPDRDELRKAVIWSEILGKPVALRE